MSQGAWWLAGLGLALISAVGCGRPAAERIYIDIDRALAQDGEADAPVLAARLPGVGGLPGEASELPALPRQVVLGDDAAELTRAALDKVKANQDRLYRRMREDLLEGYRAELRGRIAAGRQDLLDAYQKDLDEAFEEIRRRFEASAMQAGPLVYRIAWLAGFPDPDPQNRRTRRGTYVEQAMGKEAATLRPKLGAIRRAFDEEVAAILEGIKYDARADAEALEDSEAGELALIQAKADAEARAAAQTALARLTSSAFDAQRVLEGSAAVQAIRSGAAPVPARVVSPSARTVFGPRDRIISEARAFAGAQGVLLSLEPKGARDATAEFIEWRKPESK